MDKYILEWAEIEYEAEQIWIRKPELIWAKKAWNGIVKQGLASYSNDIERHLVLIRLLALAAIYKGFYRISFDESFYLESEYSDWIEHMEISPFRIGQIVGSHFEMNLEEYDDDNLLSNAIVYLINESKYEVFDAVIQEFGNEESLFLWLWITVGHSNLENPYNNKKDDELIYDEEYDIYDIFEFTDYGKKLELYESIINYNFDAVFIKDVDLFDDYRKYMAYEWISTRGEYNI